MVFFIFCILSVYMYSPLNLFGYWTLNKHYYYKYPCSVCTSNVTSRGVSYMCNRCSGWVHSKCSGLQNAAEYRRIKNWLVNSWSDIKLKW